jgi:hydrogenase maturation factor
MSSSPLPVGKLPAAALEAMLGRLPKRDPRVLIGPGLGEDAAVVDLDGRCLVFTTDPITFATDRIGWYAVHVNANDVAVMGAVPRWFFAVLLLPDEGATTALVETIMNDVEESCAKLGVAVCGGHTEITAGLDRPVVIGQMIGEVERDRLASKQQIAVGDRVLLTQGIAIEGTAILARQMRERLAPQVAADVLRRAERFLFTPGISVVDAARTAVTAGRVHAMHDPTEGGVQTGLFELAAASGLGLRVHADRIRILPETSEVCRCLGLDPFKLIASGALLIAAPPSSADAISAALQARQIPVSHVADVRPATDGRTIEWQGRAESLMPAERDEIAKLF